MLCELESEKGRCPPCRHGGGCLKPLCVHRVLAFQFLIHPPIQRLIVILVQQPLVRKLDLTWLKDITVVAHPCEAIKINIE